MLEADQPQKSEPGDKRSHAKSYCPSDQIVGRIPGHLAVITIIHVKSSCLEKLHFGVDNVPMGQRAGRLQQSHDCRRKVPRKTPANMSVSFQTGSRWRSSQLRFVRLAKERQTSDDPSLHTGQCEPRRVGVSGAFRLPRRWHRLDRERSPCSRGFAGRSFLQSWLDRA